MIKIERWFKFFWANSLLSVVGHAYGALGKLFSRIWVLGSALDEQQKIAGSCFNLEDLKMPIRHLACSSFQKY